jgi:hypothetical protein
MPISSMHIYMHIPYPRAPMIYASYMPARAYIYPLYIYPARI